MRHIKGLDTLRTFAVVMVIITHWGPHKFKSALLSFIFSQIIPDGMFGVDLFFVLSGYLITKILLTARQKAKSHERFRIIKNFYIRRSIRIFPIYFLLIFVSAYIFNNEYIKDNIFYFLTYTSNFLIFKQNTWSDFAHTWSLAIEEQFYLIWPWVIVYSPKKYLLSIIILFLTIGLISSLVLYHIYGIFSSLLLPPCITAFAIGALYAFVLGNIQYERITVKIFQILLPICIVLLLAHQLGHKLVIIRGINSILAINIIIYVCRQKYNLVTNYIFNNTLLTQIGKITYGIYLYHFLLPFYYSQFINYIQRNLHLSDALTNFLLVPPPAYLIHLGLLLLISALSYKYIEHPLLKLKRYFNYTTVKAPFQQADF